MRRPDYLANHRRGPGRRPLFVKPALALLVLLFNGCYSYIPLDTARPEVGRRVRAHLTDDGTVQLAGYLGRGISQVNGDIVRDGQDTLSLTVQSVTTWRAIEHYWEGESVALPREMISRLEERQLSPTRTALFAGGLMLGALVLRTLYDIARGEQDGSVPVDPPGKS